ncbi:hypothetical protein EV714DRAFT_222624 [Schizophyllum commune]
MSVPFPSPDARQVAPPSPPCGKASTKMFLEGGAHLNRVVHTPTESAVASRAAVGVDERA